MTLDFVKALLLEEERRHVAAIVDLTNKHPEYRLHLAYALLGGAIAVVDSFGGDAEKFLRDLRARHARPAVLVPPKAGVS